jgi:hypothetical protein
VRGGDERPENPFGRNVKVKGKGGWGLEVPCHELAEHVEQELSC